MARGNWKPERIHPKYRCRYCGRVIKRQDLDRIGVFPCHKICKPKPPEESVK
jgi:hypothetical protein